VAIIGALAWIPWVFEKIQRPTLKGRLFNQNMKEDKEGLLYLLNLSVTSLRKQFVIKEIKIGVKYSGDKKEYNGIIHWLDESFWEDTNGNKARLKIPINEFLGFMNTIPKDDSCKGYITFFVDKGTVEEFEYINIEFIPYHGNVQTIRFNQKEIDSNLFFWDDTIWVYPSSAPTIF
jgi:hypothetical protein